MARSKKGRDVHGILLLDKPGGCSSNQALQHVKRIFRARKAGHTGSLDPFATGLLPVCFGEATKTSAFLLDADKHYRALARFGESTTTGDLDGDVIRRCREPAADGQRIQSCMDEMCGEMEQIPPMYSALKHRGTPLYELARRGETVERKSRTVTIHSMVCLNWAKPELEFAVHCSKGTYVRTLAEDLARLLGSCAHLRKLHRTGVAPFTDDNAVDMPGLEALSAHPDRLDELLLPVDAGLLHLQRVNLDTTEVVAVMQGQEIAAGPQAESGMVRLYGPDGSLVGIGQRRSGGVIAPKRIFTGLVHQYSAG